MSDLNFAQRQFTNELARLCQQLQIPQPKLEFTDLFTHIAPVFAQPSANTVFIDPNALRTAKQVFDGAFVELPDELARLVCVQDKMSSVFSSTGLNGITYTSVEFCEGCLYNYRQWVHGELPASWRSELLADLAAISLAA